MAKERCLAANLEREYPIKGDIRAADDRLYVVWGSMKARCNNPHNPAYKNYGGRGIKICTEWNNNFCAFKAWALANGYDYDAPYGQCTIDRIDNDKGYEPSNCRWVSMKVQSKNKRNSKTEHCR